MPYKKPKPKKQTNRPAAQPPTAAQKLLTKLQVRPLNKHQKALFYEGTGHKPGKLRRWLTRHMATIAIIEKIAVPAYIVVAIIINPYWLLLLPALGAMIYYRERIKYLWWQIKVNLLFRDFYAHRRELHRQGTLFHHLAYKMPKKFGPAIIWAESESIQNIRFKKMQKNNQLTNKEYIKL